MNVPRSPVVAYGLAVAFFVLPLAIAIALAGLSEGRMEIGRAAPFLWFLAVVAVVIGLSLLSRESRLRAPRSSRPARPGTRYAEATLEMLGYASFVIAEFFFVMVIDWRVGAVFLGLAAVWALLWTPRSARRLVAPAANEVRCTPLAAFGLVSDPNNWHLYVPEIELAKPIDVPVGVGTFIHARIRRDGMIRMEGEEEVIAFDPGRRFGTALREAPEPSTVIYELEGIPDGTRIEYTFQSAISLPTAILGAGLRRKELVNRMSARGVQRLDRIKRLLEEPDATSV